MLPLYSEHIVLGSNKRFLSVCLSVCLDRGTSHDQIWGKCPTALTSDDLDTPRAPVQITLFVAVLFIQRSPGAPQTLFRYHNPMIIISYMMSMCIQLK